MAGLGLVDFVEENLFLANDITHYMVDRPSAEHGALHLYASRLFYNSLSWLK